MTLYNFAVASIVPGTMEILPIYIYHLQEEKGKFRFLNHGSHIFYLSAIMTKFV